MGNHIFDESGECQQWEKTPAAFTSRSPGLRRVSALPRVRPSRFVPTLKGFPRDIGANVANWRTPSEFVQVHFTLPQGVALGWGFANAFRRCSNLPGVWIRQEYDCPLMGIDILDSASTYFNANGVRELQPRATPWEWHETTPPNSERVRKVQS